MCLFLIKKNWLFGLLTTLLALEKWNRENSIYVNGRQTHIVNGDSTIIIIFRLSDVQCRVYYNTPETGALNKI